MADKCVTCDYLRLDIDALKAKLEDFTKIGELLGAISGNPVSLQVAIQAKDRELESLRARLVLAREAFKKYGGHLHSCNAYTPGLKCSCGYNRALEDTKP